MMAAMSDWTTALERRITERTARVTVVGMGYVGLSLAVELARAGLTVRGIDLDLERVNRLNRGESYLVDVPSDHSRFDYAAIAAHAPLVVDTRNAMKAYRGSTRSIRTP